MGNSAQLTAPGLVSNTKRVFGVIWSLRRNSLSDLALSIMDM